MARMQSRFRAVIRKSSIFANREFQPLAWDKRLLPSRFRPFALPGPGKVLPKVFRWNESPVRKFKCQDGKSTAKTGRTNGGIVSMAAGVSNSRTNKLSFAMKTNSNHDYFLGGSVAPKESRFEQAEIGRAPETDIFGHFGPKLKKVFPLPVATSESDGFQFFCGRSRRSSAASHTLKKGEARRAFGLVAQQA